MAKRESLNPGGGSSREDGEAIAADFLRTGNAAETARNFGCSRSTVQRLHKFYNEGKQDVCPSRVRSEDVAPIPEIFSAPDEPIEGVIERLRETSKRKKQLKSDRNWMKVPVKVKGPIGLFLVGDPHLDSPGCDWDGLMADIEVMKSVENGLAINLGDQTDNWVGRLMRKYADSEMSMSTGRRLVKWFMQESGVPWWLLIFGNHDRWHYTEDLYAEYARPVCQSTKWQAKLTLVFPNGREVRLWCAHDFPGHSQWHGLHGPLKASKMSSQAHVYACGDKHNWALFQYENAEREFTALVARARGYKSVEDDYAEEYLGKSLQREGGTIMLVIDPDSKTEAGLITPFADLEKGALFLKGLQDA